MAETSSTLVAHLMPDSGGAVSATFASFFLFTKVIRRVTEIKDCESRLAVQSEMGVLDRYPS